MKKKPTDVDPTAAGEQSEERLTATSSRRHRRVISCGRGPSALKQLEGPAGWWKQMNRPAALRTGSESPLWLEIPVRGRSMGDELAAAAAVVAAPVVPFREDS